MNIESVPVDSIKTHPENTRFFTDIDGELWKAFIADVSEHGIREPLTVDRATGYVVKGNQRLRAAMELAFAEVPVKYEDYESEDAAIDDLIRDNVMRRDMSYFEKYRLVAVLQERIASRQGDHEGNQHTGQRASAGNRQKLEPPRDQIAKILGLCKDDITAANLLATLPDDVQKEFFAWASSNDPSKKAAQEKIRELKRLKAEVKELKDVRKLVKRKEELEKGMEIIMSEGSQRVADAEAATRITRTIATGWEWLQTEAAGIQAMQVTAQSISSTAPLVQEFMRNLDAYRDAIARKFTQRETP